MRNSFLFTASEWITRFAYVNILWIVFSLLGLIVFGFFPATVAMFTLVRQWIMGNTDQPVFSTFWSTYKKEFVKSNLFGLIIVLTGFVFYINYQYIILFQGGFHDIIKIPLLVFMIAISLVILYVFPTFVHFNVKFLDIWKNSFFIMILNPLHNISMLAAIVVILYVMQFVPGTIVFFSGSLITFIIMGTCFHAFQRIEAKQQKLTEKTN
ncbi:YesL family protein [Gracilibacillus oryzae]|uniref:YesL family protein n=1 Tax=Gracilibacillus oryzae TaxID=1672701 RepID=A0A7C8GTK0_9BACI|nr:YesL family protein [Gracilibacillus oryzae]KAB8137644.1 YesL family protein [Gracilibacillus oryzae]